MLAYRACNCAMQACEAGLGRICKQARQGLHALDRTGASSGLARPSYLAGGWMLGEAGEQRGKATHPARSKPSTSHCGGGPNRHTRAPFNCFFCNLGKKVFTTRVGLARRV